MQQIWRDVLGYEGLYQVSNMGRVKSLGNDKKRKEKILKINYCKCKYKSRVYIQPRINLSKKNKRTMYFISRLEYEAFNGEIPQKMQVDHINNNPQDNRLENLQLLTPSENIKKIYNDNPNYKNKGGSKPKKIICLNNGIIYNSINEASRKLNLNSRHISEVCKIKRKTECGYKFIYVDD